MAEPGHVSKLDVHYDMLSVAMISQFCNVDSTLICTLLTKTPSQAPSDWQDYKVTIMDVYNTNIRYEPVNKVKNEIGPMFIKKVEWFLTDHE